MLATRRDEILSWNQFGVKLRTASVFHVQAMRVAGCEASELQKAGFSARAMLDAGVSLEQMAKARAHVRVNVNVHVHVHVHEAADRSRLQ